MRTRCLFPALISMALLAQSLFAASTIQFPPRYSPSVSENAGSALLTVQRTDDLETVVTVDYATSDDTATAGHDYIAASGTLTFAAGETNRIVSVPLLDDGLLESAEQFRVALTNATGGAVVGSRSAVTVRILDNETPIELECDAYGALEDEGSVLIGVVRGFVGETVTLDYTTSNGTAAAGEDYTAVAGTLTFEPGENLKLLTVPILNDRTKEPVETFRIYLTNAPAGLVGTVDTATISIWDNDPGVQFEYNKFWVRENAGILALKVFRGNDVDLPPFTVDYTTANLTAMTGEDYTETAGTLDFAEGEPFHMLSVPILWNQSSELDTKFRLTLSNPSAGVVLGTNVTATNVILDMTGMTAHRFDGIDVLPDHSVRLTLGGSVHNRFADYFDLYPIDVSTNLLDWTPLITLQRTNSSTNAFTYTDTQAGASSVRFYRTATNHLVTAMLKPSGPHSVGMVNRWLTDPTRRNRFGVSTNGSFMVMIWYPALRQSGQSPVSYEDAPLLRDPGWQAQFFDRDPYFVSHAVMGAPCTRDGAPYPIVLYSDGLGGIRFGCAEKAENLASHGYIVVGIDHYDTPLPAFPDGTVGSVPTPALTAAGFQDRVKDLAFVLDQLTNWNSTDSILAGRCDLDRTAAIGMSWGGGVAGEFARVDERCKAAVVLEGYVQNADELVSQGLPKPCLSIYSDPITVPGSELLLFSKATHDAIWFQIRSTQHGNFSDWYWFSFPRTLQAGREAAGTINAYSLWFLNKYLKGSTDPMPALADYPRVINFKEK